MDATTNPWWESELAGCVFVDARLGQRLRNLIERMAGAIGASLPLACQDWASTKAAYRFFSNDRVSEAQILAGHFQATRDRFAATDGPILVIQDTTEFTFQRERAEAVGITCRVNSGKDKAGRFRMHTVCGLLMHTSLAVTTEGLPLGLSAVKFWSRQQFNGTAALKRKINPTRVPIEHKESIRWLENLRQSMALLGAFAAGDRVVFLENSRELGVKNGTLGTVLEARDGRLTARLDEGGRAGTIAAIGYDAVDHGYATTIHKAQGITVDRAFVVGSGSMDRHMAYVALTRHRDGVRMYAGRDEFRDFAALSSRLSRGGVKETTLDYARRRGLEAEERESARDGARTTAERLLQRPAAAVERGSGPEERSAPA